MEKIEITYSKQNEFHEWYTNVIFATGLLDYYDVSGCYVYLPPSYELWEKIQNVLNSKFSTQGVKNVYFPMLITKQNLTKEASHIEGFTPEVVWVSKTGTTDNDIGLAIRPTSECAFYPTYAKMIQSHIDLPLIWNQWCSVMRWEFNSPTPFIRSREFLWQEGHGAFKTYDDANNNALTMLSIYENVYTQTLKVPVIMGVKTAKERFAGAINTYTIETYIPEANRAIQCATSHNLGQNFSKMFNIKYQTETGTTDFVWQTSWGFTTRSIGVTIMVHGDDKGLILPSTLLRTKIVVVPIYKNNNYEKVDKYINDIFKNVDGVHIDNSDRKPGWKYYYWEAKGVPLRIEIGARDVDNNTFVVYRRDTMKKTTMNLESINKLPSILDEIDAELYNKAKERLYNSIVCYSNFDNDYTKNGLYYVPLCDNIVCEEAVRNKIEMKSICRPLDSQKLPSVELVCINCKTNENVTGCLFAKTF